MVKYLKDPYHSCTTCSPFKFPLGFTYESIVNLLLTSLFNCRPRQLQQLHCSCLFRRYLQPLPVWWQPHQLLVFSLRVACDRPSWQYLLHLLRRRFATWQLFRQVQRCHFHRGRGRDSGITRSSLLYLFFFVIFDNVNRLGDYDIMDDKKIIYDKKKSEIKCNKC